MVWKYEHAAWFFFFFFFFLGVMNVSGFYIPVANHFEG